MFLLPPHPSPTFTPSLSLPPLSFFTNSVIHSPALSTSWAQKAQLPSSFHLSSGLIIQTSHSSPLWGQKKGGGGGGRQRLQHVLGWLCYFRSESPGEPERCLVAEHPLWRGPCTPAHTTACQHMSTSLGLCTPPCSKLPLDYWRTFLTCCPTTFPPFLQGSAPAPAFDASCQDPQPAGRWHTLLCMAVLVTSGS